LGLVYDFVDGADLFSSAFKIAALREPRFAGNVRMAPSLADLQLVCERETVNFDENAVPFMSEAGVWLYGFCPESRRVAKWDLENGEFCEFYACMEDVLREWAEVTAGV